jgi:hypothetical protein
MRSTGRTHRRADQVRPLARERTCWIARRDHSQGQLLCTRHRNFPGSGPAGVHNAPQYAGDNPDNPRDPDKFDAENGRQREFRQRFIPSGLAREIDLDVFERLSSFEPNVTSLQRLFDAYTKEVARVDQNGDGIVSAFEGDPDGASDGFDDNDRLFLPATAFHRFAVTREINDGILAPRFAPSQRAWILTGVWVPVHPTVPASVERDGDDR